MSQVLDFRYYKAKKEQEGNSTTDTKEQRIKSSLERINALMQELKDVSSFQQEMSSNEEKKKKMAEERRKANEAVKAAYRLKK